MSRFTVTIESDHADGGTMTIHLDTASGTARVLEVTVAAAAGGSVSAASFSQLALDRLVAAFSPELPTSAAVAAPPATPAVAAPAQRVSSEPSPVPPATAPPAVVEATPVPTQAAAQEPTVTAKRTTRPRAKTAEAGLTPANDVATSPAPTPENPPAKKATKTAAKAAKKTRMAAKARTGAPTEDAGRQYRRMPDPAELVVAYNEATSVTELAGRYEVPRHTMNGWLARLRRDGLIVARRGSAKES